MLPNILLLFDLVASVLTDSSASTILTSSAAAATAGTVTSSVAGASIACFSSSLASAFSSCFSATLTLCSSFFPLKAPKILVRFPRLTDRLLVSFLSALVSSSVAELDLSGASSVIGASAASLVSSFSTGLAAVATPAVVAAGPAPKKKSQW